MSRTARITAAGAACLFSILASSSIAQADDTVAKPDDTKTDAVKTDAAPPEAAKPEAAKPEAAKTDGTLLVHVASPKTVYLETRTQSGAPWSRVCTSPCDARLPVGVDYRITGEGVTASESFLLDGSRGEPVNLKVRPASRNTFILGASLAGGGAAILLGGVVVLIATAAGPKEVSNDGTTRTGFTDAMWIGTTMVVAGAGTGVFGAAMALANKSTRVNGNTIGPQPQGSRQPSFERDAHAQAQAVPAPAFSVSVPLVSGTF